MSPKYVIMHTLEPMTNPHQWESFRLDRSFVLSALAKLQYITSKMLLCVGCEKITSSSRFRKDMHFLYQEGLHLLPMTNGCP